MKYLVTGGCGFLGSNLAAEVLRRGEELVVLDNMSRVGSEANRSWLASRGASNFVVADTRDAHEIERAVGGLCPDVVFHVAGQVAMTTSIENPRLDFETNALGTFNVLEAVRKHAPDACVVYSSTNKVYGDLESYRYEETPTRYVCPERPLGFDEATPLEFHSPYGCSKGAAEQYVLDYARMFGLKTVVFRHSSIYGGRQFATFDQGWVGWFCRKALEQKAGVAEPFTIAGNGKQVRDLLYADDAVACYFAAVERIDAARGQPFNIGGGIEQSMSLLELFAHLEDRLSVRLTYARLAPRSSDQKLFVADIRKAAQVLGWVPRVTKATGVDRMLAWVGESQSGEIG